MRRNRRGSIEEKHLLKQGKLKPINNIKLNKPRRNKPTENIKNVLKVNMYRRRMNWFVNSRGNESTGNRAGLEGS